MMRYIVILLIMLSACSPCRQVVEQTDSVSHVAHERDSVSHTGAARDSVHHRDSIYVYQSGDTLYIYNSANSKCRTVVRIEKINKFNNKKN